MFGLNPVATGILLGAVGGPMGMALGGGIGAMYDHAQGQKRDAQKEMHRLTEEGVKNQNAIVEQTFQKRRAAYGLGESAPAEAQPAGLASAQEGSILSDNSQTRTSRINLLG